MPSGRWALMLWWACSWVAALAVVWKKFLRWFLQIWFDATRHVAYACSWNKNIDPWIPKECCLHAWNFNSLPFGRYLQWVGWWMPWLLMPPSPCAWVCLQIGWKLHMHDHAKRFYHCCCNFFVFGLHQLKTCLATLLVAMPFWERGSIVQSLTHCGAPKASACTLFQHL